jgi:hypothetical protein
VPGQTPRGRGRSQNVDWPQLNIGDRRRWRFGGSLDDLKALLERGHDEEFSCGSAARNWLLEHLRRRLPTAVHSGQQRFDATDDAKDQRGALELC